jgi:putative hydrolase of the HAD superfamily
LSTLKAIFFDIDDTLYSTSEFSRRARENAVKAMVHMGLRLGENECLRELEEGIKEFSSNFEHHFDKLLLRLGEEAYRGVNPAVLVAAAVTAYHDTKFTQLQPFPDVKPALEALSRTELIVGVITMGPQVKQAEKLLRLGLIDYFDPGAIFISDQIGVGKPNVKLYMKACRAVGVWPVEAMYVGDNPPNDVDPPNQLGMTTVLMRREGKYAGVQGVTKPAFEVNTLAELVEILRTQCGIEVPVSAGE